MQYSTHPYHPYLQSAEKATPAICLPLPHSSYMSASICARVLCTLGKQHRAPFNAYGNTTKHRQRNIPCPAADNRHW